VSLVNGKKLGGGKSVTTVNALGQPNGSQDYATPKQVQELMHHIRTYQSPSNNNNNNNNNKNLDLREPLRRIEQKLLTEYTGLLIGNQCLDFQKQDGITEIEEATMANTVERRLNDLLWRDEQDGKLTINRKPIYVSCVSNFTNFLDLFRKTIRSLELGVPCLILGRSNTVQHTYRWVKLLVDLCEDQGVDPGMVTYLSCSLEDIQNITTSCQDDTGNLYATCSRTLAASIKSGYPNTVASTGGPNTMIALDWTETIQDALACSASIESSGQCTALRHAVVPPSTTSEDIGNMFKKVQSIPDAPHAIRNSLFDRVFEKHQGSPEPSAPSYTRHETADAFYKVDTQFPPNHIQEYWRKVVVDVSRVDCTSPQNKKELAAWLNTNQPISLAVNGASRQATLDYGLDMWERTGMVVNTIGIPDNPALTCQARPQEAEVFGEFPPRHELKTYTKFPVVVPSSTPAYDASYTESYLTSKSTMSAVVIGAAIQPLVDDVTNELVRGYCVVLWEYLKDATQENPKRGFGTCRTAMWGLQRPPLGTTTHIRCSAETSWDDIVPMVLLFQGTNASPQLQVSVDPQNMELAGLCEKHGMSHVLETREAFDSHGLAPGDNAVHVDGSCIPDFPMVGQFLSTLFPLGHLKSTEPNDEEFVARVKVLQKWLQTVD
jgi:hypothetical protein